MIGRTGTTKPRGSASIAWVVLCCVGLLTVAGQVVAASAGEGVDLLLIPVLSFPAVGALIASRQPHNTIAWVMVAIGAVLAVSELFAIYSYFGLAVGPGSLPGADLALALEQHLWVPVLGLPGTFLILLFPDGRLPSPRWKPWAYFCALALVLCYAGLTVLPGSFTDAGYPDVRNPLGIEALARISGVVVSLAAMIPVAMIGCAMALVRRFRRSHGLERVQLKWLTAAAGLVAIAYLGAMVLNFTLDDGGPPQWLEVVSGAAIFAFILIPAAIGVAIFRYRLYDIDVIVNRTLVYGALTATLTGAYFLLVTTLQSLLRPLAGESRVAVAGSTLVVATIFRPVRGFIQTFVDRRFYRSKFDAEATLQDFSARLRDEVDLETLIGELLAVVNRTLKPANTTLWLRQP